MLGNLTGWHLIAILAVVLLLFGSAKLPALAKGVGESLRIFKTEIKTADDASAVPPASVPLAPPAADRATQGGPPAPRV